jgi:hypothetical protein
MTESKFYKDLYIKKHFLKNIFYSTDSEKQTIYGPMKYPLHASHASIPGTPSMNIVRQQQPNDMIEDMATDNPLWMDQLVPYNDNLKYKVRPVSSFKSNKSSKSQRIYFSPNFILAPPPLQPTLQPPLNFRDSPGTNNSFRSNYSQNYNNSFSKNPYLYKPLLQPLSRPIPRSKSFTTNPRKSSVSSADTFNLNMDYRKSNYSINNNNHRTFSSVKSLKSFKSPPTCSLPRHTCSFNSQKSFNSSTFSPKNLIFHPVDYSIDRKYFLPSYLKHRHSTAGSSRASRRLGVGGRMRRNLKSQSFLESSRLRL